MQDQTNTKKCGECSKRKPVAEFYKQFRRGREGYCHMCRECSKKRLERYYALNKERLAIGKQERLEQKAYSGCKKIKPAAAFSTSRSSRDGLDYLCRECKREANRVARRKKPTDRSIHWRYHLYRKYRLTPEDFQAMMEAQEGRCAICAVDIQGNPVVDHNHKTGKVRALLCVRCNALLAGIESPGFIEAALAYLSKHQS